MNTKFLVENIMQAMMMMMIRILYGGNDDRNIIQTMMMMMMIKIFWDEHFIMNEESDFAKRLDLNARKK